MSHEVFFLKSPARVRAHARPRAPGFPGAVFPFGYYYLLLYPIFKEMFKYLTNLS